MSAMRRLAVWTHRHTDTDTHTHMHVHTHKHTHTHTHTHACMCTHTKLNFLTYNLIAMHVKVSATKNKITSSSVKTVPHSHTTIILKLYHIQLKPSTKQFVSFTM